MMDKCLLKSEGRRKFWLAIAAVFVFGAFTSNFAWLVYSNYKDARYIDRITKVENSYKYQLGQQRTKIEVKIDSVLDKLDRLPPNPVIIDARSALEEAKNAVD